jgi:hypothetical protein
MSQVDDSVNEGDSADWYQRSHADGQIPRQNNGVLLEDDQDGQRHAHEHQFQNERVLLAPKGVQDSIDVAGSVHGNDTPFVLVAADVDLTGVSNSVNAQHQQDVVTLTGVSYSVNAHYYTGNHNTMNYNLGHDTTPITYATPLLHIDVNPDIPPDSTIATTTTPPLKYTPATTRPLTTNYKNNTPIANYSNNTPTPTRNSHNNTRMLQAWHTELDHLVHECRASIGVQHSTAQRAGSPYAQPYTTPTTRITSTGSSRDTLADILLAVAYNNTPTTITTNDPDARGSQSSSQSIPAQQQHVAAWETDSKRFGQDTRRGQDMFIINQDGDVVSHGDSADWHQHSPSR